MTDIEKNTVQKRLFKILSANLAFTFIASSLVTLITYRILSSRDTSSLEGKQADFIEAIAGIFWILVLTVSSATVYLNLRDRVRRKIILSFISFFLLPILLTILFRTLGHKDTEWLSFYIATSYYLIGHSISYLMFVRLNKTLLSQTS